MCEFMPIVFFSGYQDTPIEEEQPLPNPELAKQLSREYNQSIDDSESTHLSEFGTINKRTIVSKSSEKHNMVKQLITTIKLMVGKFLDEVSSSYTSREIIAETWKVFEKTKNPTKQILKAMFDKEINSKLLAKNGLQPILKKYGNYEFLNAMEDLRMEILFKMRGESLKTHLFNRNIEKKDELAAYIQYFVEEELKNGKISSRLTDAATKRMKEILQNNRTQNDCIDCYLNTQIEVLARFAS